MEWPKTRNAQVHIALVTGIDMVVDSVVLVSSD